MIIHGEQPQGQKVLRQMGNGIITLMGSGEFSGTMVEVHKELIQRYGSGVEAVFLDTPAGFQLNVEALSAKAVAYFDRHIQRPLTVASFKSMQQADALEMAKAYDLLNRADYILMGPGSPTYALEQWRSSRVPDIFLSHLQKGGTIVAASAAALTMGTATLPVYEIYKVGQDPYWVSGLQVLDQFGFNWAVLPHWNNTEGGTHDTRFCFMGSDRLQQLRRQLPESVNILGVDEHTALEIDLSRETASVRGIGRVTLLSREGRSVFEKGEPIPLARLREGEPGSNADFPAKVSKQPVRPGDGNVEGAADVWQQVHDLEAGIKSDLAQQHIEHATRNLLALEGLISQSYELLMEKEALGAARDLFRELLAELGTRLACRQADQKGPLGELVNQLVALRDDLRQQKQWTAADAIRDSLQDVGIVINDAADGTRWEYKD